MHLLICLFLPPTGFYFSTKSTISSYFVLFSWIGAYFVFFKFSVLLGVIFHLGLSFFSLTYYWNKEQLRKDLNIHSIFHASTVILTLLLTVGSINQKHRLYNVQLESIEDINAGRYLFNQKCSVCHLTSEANYVGPGLQGIYNKSAGTSIGYFYSEGLANAEFVWDSKTLTAYLKNQNDFIEGTRMIISPLEDEEIRQIVKFMETL